MTDVQECPHGDDPSICPPCQVKPSRSSARVRRVATTARFQGRCPSCGGWIDAGDTLILDDDGSWVCEDFCELVAGSE